MIKLSKRLKAIAEYVGKTDKIADIGTDHAFLPIYLVQNSLVKSAIAMDIRKGPLEKARLHIKESGLDDLIETRLSDGMKKLLPSEVDTVVIAGLGGNLMINILEAAKFLKPFLKNYILSPHSEWDLVRKYLLENSYDIVSEDMIKDEGKYYIILKVKDTDSLKGYDREIYYKFGYFLIKNKNEILKEYLEKELIKYKDILDSLTGSKSTDLIDKRKTEIQEYISLILEAKNEM